MTDSFREINPSPKANPGYTWSTIYKMGWDKEEAWRYTLPEPQDRIDFIYYKGKGLKTTESKIYASDFVTK